MFSQPGCEAETLPQGEGGCGVFVGDGGEGAEGEDERCGGDAEVEGEGGGERGREGLVLLLVGAAFGGLAGLEGLRLG